MVVGAGDVEVVGAVELLGITVAGSHQPPGGSPTLPELVAFLLDKRLAKQKFPEHLVLVD
jgi:hypothetical protein